MPDSPTATEDTNSLAASLLAEAKQGSQSALGRILQSYREYLLAIAGGELGANMIAKVAPSDLVQQTYSDAYTDFHKFQGTTVGEFVAWLRSILDHNLRNQVRAFRQTEKRDLDRETRPGTDACDVLWGADPASPTASKVLSEQEELAALHAALGRLDGPSRTAVELRNFERLSFEEIGEQLGKSAEAARKIWARAIEQLRIQLDSNHDSRSPGNRPALR